MALIYSILLIAPFFSVEAKVDPLKEEEIVTAVWGLMNDEAYRVKLKSMARIQARTFSWDKCTVEIMEVYNEIINRPKL